MSEVSVLGLGPMGLALAQAMLGGRRDITVWNRTASKAEALSTSGGGAFEVAASAPAAVAAAPVVIACVTDYSATFASLEGADLDGKVLVQLATGTPREAREAAGWASRRGAHYLDGAILAVPSQMGQPESTILVSGSATALEKSEAMLRDTAGTVAFVGENVGAASALDLAFLSHLFGGLIGFYHGARICESEGLPVGDLGKMLAGAAPAIGGMVGHDAERIQAEHYAQPQSSLETCARGIDLLVRHAREARLDGDVPVATAALFERGRRAGLGDESPAALIKVLRACARREHR